MIKNNKIHDINEIKKNKEHYNKYINISKVKYKKVNIITNIFNTIGMKISYITTYKNDYDNKIIKIKKKSNQKESCNRLSKLSNRILEYVYIIKNKFINRL